MRSCSRSAAGVCATVRAGLAAGAGTGDEVWNRLISPQPASARAAQNRAGATKARRLILVARCPKRLVTVVMRLCSAGSIAADQFNLPHPERFYPRSTPRFDEAADTNSFIFEGLKSDSRSLERRTHAP